MAAGEPGVGGQVAAGEPVWGAKKSPFGNLFGSTLDPLLSVFGDLFGSNNVQYLIEGSQNIDSSRLLEEPTAISKCDESD